jgi:hypothetical protein
MSTASQDRRLELPASLAGQLWDFRRRVWAIKSVEAACGALLGVVLGFLAVYLLDRAVETPAALRLAIFSLAIAGCAAAALYMHRWVWRQRTLDQLARLLSRRYPSLGDSVLGIIELVRSDFEQHRSLALCQAAIGHVAAEASRKNLADAVPAPRHRLWLTIVALPAAVALTLAALYPAAAGNAWARFLTPWRPVPRYTFTLIEPLPERLVIPHGEAMTLPVRLAKDSRWQPSEGLLYLGGQSPLAVRQKEGGYEFALPPQIAASQAHLRIGDVRQQIALEPMLRPELTSIVASVKLPDYLQRTKPIEKDARGGTISLVCGSQATLIATANRTLASGTIDGQSAMVSGATIKTEPLAIEAPHKLVFAWQDEHGLAGQVPFTLTINARDDEPPSLASEGLPRQKIVLDSETLAFQVRAQDDFGVKAVGIEWQTAADMGVDGAPLSKIQGERLLAAGGSEQDTLELAGTFCATTLGIEPQPLAVRLYAEDYLPGRERVYSPVYQLYVLSAEQHAIWLTEQMSRWHRQSLEVRDREMQLHHTNQQLRLLADEELDRPEVRRQIKSQSSAERANGRRLTTLTLTGEELIRQALRNSEFGVGHLEKWAEMLQILKDIAGNRMPNVADLLKQSAQSPGTPAAGTKHGPLAGQMRSTAAGQGNTTGDKPTEPKPPVPTIVDRESSQQPPPPEGAPDEPAKVNSSQPRLGLPVTTVASVPPPPRPGSTPAADKLDAAVKAQQELLAEFDKIADELNELLANLEGSTLVKRLKAASRKQYTIAGKIGEELPASFGHRMEVNDAHKRALQQLAGRETDSSQDLSKIMDDLEAYFERRRYQRFKVVLDEMRQEDPVGSLRQLGDELLKEAGLSLAQCEFWSDTFDRWADNLLDPACSGKCPGAKSRASLPPSIVLEAMQILKAEINLREETRVAEQARPALSEDDYSKRAKPLSTTQEGLAERIAALAVRIAELPDGKQEFAYEIALMGRVEQVMDDATGILNRPETGIAAIGAETEAIELLLQSKRINPRGRGGGGSSPGGGGGGETLDAALALFGAGTNDKEVREEHDVGQATGTTGSALPEEFRAGLDRYFNRLESKASER